MYKNQIQDKYSMSSLVPDGHDALEVRVHAAYVRSVSHAPPQVLTHVIVGQHTYHIQLVLPSSWLCWQGGGQH